MKSNILFGTSILGNLYYELKYQNKKELIQEIIQQINKKKNNEEKGEEKENQNQKIIFDTAGKYGAGLALETLGKILEELNIDTNDIQISNKLGWRRMPLIETEPTFEKGIWINLQYDAYQDISYEGIMESYKEGNQLLGKYRATIVSIHDPDEYLHNAKDENDLIQRKYNLDEAYRALFELKSRGEVESIGVGAKDYNVIEYICNRFQLDWIMTACQMTPYLHPKPHRDLLSKLFYENNIHIINSAVFNSGFLIGGDFFNYQHVQQETHPELFDWREKFNQFCSNHSINPVHICIQFSFIFQEIKSIALNPGSIDQLHNDLFFLKQSIPREIWQQLQNEQLISNDIDLNHLL